MEEEEGGGRRRKKEEGDEEKKVDTGREGRCGKKKKKQKDRLDTRTHDYSKGKRNRSDHLQGNKKKKEKKKKKKTIVYTFHTHLPKSSLVPRSY